MMRFQGAMICAAAASLCLPSSFALAQETRTAGPDRIELTAAGVTLSAQMPCDQPSNGPEEPGAPESRVCIVGDQMFIFAVSSNVTSNHPSSMPSDFDAAYAEIEGSNDTVMIEESEADGRRVMSAERGPDPKFGLMRAIEFAPDSLAYAITMSRPSRAEPLSDEYKQAMRDFVASLEVSE